MRIVCCDDDTRVIEQLRDYLQLYFKKISTPFPEFASFSSGEELVKYNQQVDIAFLDVEMAGLSGIHTGAELKRKNPNIIIFIVTSYPDYLDEAMRSNLKQVRIIHGKGTGVLRAAVQQELKKNKFVKKFRLGQYGEGEDGVTIAEFG